MAQFNPDLFIAHTGVQTALGKTVRISAANIRAGFVRFNYSSTLEDKNWKPIKTARAEYLDEFHENTGRFLRLGAGAFLDALPPLLNPPGKPEKRIIPVYIGLPKQRPGLSEELPERITEYFQRIDGLSEYSFQFHFFRSGHTSPIMALKQLREDMEKDSIPVALIGGIESYLDVQTIQWLEKEKLLQCNRQKGLIPGEAAGFNLIATREGMETYGLSPLAQLIAFDLTREENDFFSGEVCEGGGLSLAIQNTLHVLDEDQKADQVYSTVSGIPYYGDEFGYTLMKAGTKIRSPKDTKFFASHWGDIGAASIPVYMAMGTAPKSQKRAAGPYSLFFTSSFGKTRGAVLLQLLLKP